MTEDVLMWLESLKEDKAFGKAVWDSLVWLNEVEVVGVNVTPILTHLRQSYLDRKPVA